MKYIRADQKGAIQFNGIWIWIFVILAVLGFKYYNDHRDDVVIHPPHIDVH